MSGTPTPKVRGSWASRHPLPSPAAARSTTASSRHRVVDADEARQPRDPQEAVDSLGLGVVRRHRGAAIADARAASSGGQETLTPRATTRLTRVGARRASSSATTPPIEWPSTGTGPSNRSSSGSTASAWAANE